MHLLRHPPPRRPDPEPLELHDRLVVAVGTGLWLAALVLLGVADLGGSPVAGWWLQMCAAGAVLGLVGLRVLSRREIRREARLERSRAQRRLPPG